jgi:predicted transglutaminase-like cysteine proteinase
MMPAIKMVGAFMGYAAKTIKANSILAATIVATIVGCAGQAVAIPFAKRLLLFTAVVEYAKPPVAWYDFCRQNPGDCEADPLSPREVAFTDESFEELTNINRLVNTNIKPKTDKKHWGLADKWSYPDDGYGDCEDYALLKRKLLIEIGWSPAALLMGVVWDKDAGHAVLIVRTDKGEYVLDNQTSKILLWSATRYKFVKRQSPRDLKQWVYVDGDPRKPNLALTEWEKSMPVEKAVLTASSREAQPKLANLSSEKFAVVAPAADAQPTVESAIDVPMNVAGRLPSSAESKN